MSALLVDEKSDKTKDYESAECDSDADASFESTGKTVVCRGGDDGGLWCTCVRG